MGDSSGGACKNLGLESGERRVKVSRGERACGWSILNREQVWQCEEWVSHLGLGEFSLLHPLSVGAFFLYPHRAGTGRLVPMGVGGRQQ